MPILLTRPVQAHTPATHDHKTHSERDIAYIHAGYRHLHTYSIRVKLKALTEMCIEQ